MSPGNVGVDFRAACFCHRKVVDLGFVCSVCLSSELGPFMLFLDALVLNLMQSNLISCLTQIPSFLRSSRRCHVSYVWNEAEAWELWPETRGSGQEEEEAEEQARRRRRNRKWRCNAGSMKFSSRTKSRNIIHLAQSIYHRYKA